MKNRYCSIAFVLSKLALILLFLAPIVADSALYFNAKIYGPVTNIYSITESGKVEKITKETAWRDVEHDVSSSKNVVFTSNRKSTFKMDLNKTFDVYDLYFFDNSKKTIEKLTDTREREYSPKFHPSGKYVAYLKILTPKRTQLRLIDLQKRKDTLLAEAKHIFDFSWSPNGELIVFSESTNSSTSLKTVYHRTIEINKLVQHSIGKNIKTSAYLVAPAWSPNGNYIAYITHPINSKEMKSLFVLDIKSRKISRISEGKGHVQPPVQWSKNSNKLLYSSLIDYRFYFDETIMDKVYEGGMQILISDLEGKTKQMTHGNHYHGKPTYSPDESKVAFLFSEKLGGALNLSLKTLNLDSGAKTTIYNNVQRESSLVWR